MKRIIYPGWAVPPELYVDYNPDDILDYGFFKGVESDFTKLDFNLTDLNDAFLEKFIPDEPCTIIAHSLGSLLALRSSQLSDNIKSIVLMAGFPRFTQAESDFSFGKPLSAVVMMNSMMNLSAKMVLDKFYEAMIVPSDFSFEPQGKIDTARLQNGLTYLEKTDLRESLKDIHFPVLIIHGEKDQIVSVDMAGYLAENINNSTLELISDAGHAMPFTHTEKCLDLIENFIA